MTSGNLTEIDAPLNQTTKFTYDAMDRIATQLDPRQKSTTLQYITRNIKNSQTLAECIKTSA